MRTVYVTRREHFNAAHKLWNESWSEEKNYEVFGRCANKNWHGHNYELFVTVKGQPHPDTGYVVDLKGLSTLIRDEVTEKLDHKNLNLDVPFMEGILASTENLTFAIWDILKQPVQEMGCTLHCVKLYETANNFAEYYGD
ncbi:MAG TPA: 6-carboxytetrahydropterin synthase [Luteibaculaceae bacterium]|nr:6-carboxytetrahydropterin synthase [Luteibaculaceae bacterium]